MEHSDNAANIRIPVGEDWRRYDAELEFYERIKEDILQDAEEAGMSPKQEFKLELGIEEIAVNIISYAYKDPGYMPAFSPLIRRSRGAFRPSGPSHETWGDSHRRPGRRRLRHFPREKEFFFRSISA